MQLNGSLVDVALLGSVAFTAAYFIGPLINKREKVAKVARSRFDEVAKVHKDSGEKFMDSRKLAAQDVQSILEA